MKMEPLTLISRGQSRDPAPAAPASSPRPTGHQGATGITRDQEAPPSLTGITFLRVFPFCPLGESMAPSNKTAELGFLSRAPGSFWGRPAAVL